MTNFENITQSREALAEFLVEMIDDNCSACPLSEREVNDCKNRRVPCCYAELSFWLDKPYKESEAVKNESDT